MKHPERVAGLLREGSTWRDPFQLRGGRAFDALDWQDACLMLAGCPPLAFAAFVFRHSQEPPTHELVEHLLDVAKREINGAAAVSAEQLVTVLLLEERAPESQRSERHRAAAMGLTRSAWRHRAARPYARLAAALDVLVSDAWRVVRRRTDEAA